MSPLKMIKGNIYKFGKIELSLEKLTHSGTMLRVDFRSVVKNKQVSFLVPEDFDFDCEVVK